MEATFLVALVEQAEAKYDHAIFLFEEAKQLAAKCNSNKYKSDCLIHMGESYVKRGKFREAEGIYKEALPLAEQVSGSKGILVGEIFNCLGLVAKKCSGLWITQFPILNLRAALDYDKAIQHYNNALQIIPADHLVWFELVTNLADVHRKKENFAEARKLYTESLGKIKAIYGDNHPQVRKFLVNYIKSYFETDR